MTTTYLTAAAIAATMIAAGPALAQDRSGFDGIYIGAAGGYDVQGNDVGSSILFDRGFDGRFGDTVTTANNANAFSPGFCNGRAASVNAPGRTSVAAPAQPAGTGCRNDEDGWAYYGRIGVDQQMGRIVVGVVGEFGRTELNDSVSAFSSTPANYVMYRQVNWEAGIRGRVGYTPNDSTLFYGTFGPGYARIDREFSTTNTANTFATRGRRDQFGIQGGGGVEQKIGEHLSIGLEYMYHQYRDDEYRVRVGGTANTPTTNPFVLGNIPGTDFRRSDDKFRWHSMRATAAFRF